MFVDLPMNNTDMFRSEAFFIFTKAIYWGYLEERAQKLRVNFYSAEDLLKMEWFFKLKTYNYFVPKSAKIGISLFYLSFIYIYI